MVLKVENRYSPYITEQSKDNYLSQYSAAFYS